MILPLLKSLHIIGFVSWFAAMFYLGRLFVYHKEALEKNDEATNILVAQYAIMEWRVYKIIMTPAMILTWLCGTWMLHLYGMEWFKQNMWMHHKLVFLIMLSAYHGMSKGMIKNIQANKVKYTSFQFRLFNEVPTVLLFLIVPLAVFKNQINPLVLIPSVIGLIAILILFTYVYKYQRLKK
jgi:protoporphyrinogen IX oxidase